MAEGSLACKQAGNGAQERKPHRQPLAEKAMGEPIWVHIPDKGQIRHLARAVFEELSRMGLSCVRGLQTEPHVRFSIVDSFEVYIKEGRREPENAGIVTLYQDGEGGPMALKLNPACPADYAALHKALAEAVGSAVKAHGAKEIEIIVREGHSFEFPK
ncbi:MAG: hypothetical protein AB1324_05295 [Candidatus Micrarchaeota archaeon]